VPKAPQPEDKAKTRVPVLRLPIKLHDRLKGFASHKGKYLNAFAAKCIEERLDQLEREDQKKRT